MRNTLALEQNGTELPQDQFDQETGRGHKRGTVQDLADRLCQVLIPKGFGRAEIDRAGYLFTTEQKEKRLGKIVHVHPEKPLAFAVQRTAQEIVEQRHHLAKRTAVLAYDDAEAGDDDARS